MKPLRTYGPEALIWIFEGIRYKNGLVDKVSTIDNHLSLWITLLGYQAIKLVRDMADSWTHLRHTKKRSVKFSEGMHKPQWVVAADNGKAVVSPKIVEFGRHFFPEENAHSKKCTNFLAWLLAHLDAECHALRPPALPDGYLRDTLKAPKNTARQLRRNQRQLRFEASGIVHIHLFYIKCRISFGEFGRGALCYICNNGKANQNSHLIFVAAIAHFNLRMCLISAFAGALLLLWQDPIAKSGAEGFMTYMIAAILIALWKSSCNTDEREQHR